MSAVEVVGTRAIAQIVLINAQLRGSVVDFVSREWRLNTLKLRANVMPSDKIAIPKFDKDSRRGSARYYPHYSFYSPFQTFCLPF